MKNITITVTDDQGMVIFETSTPEIAKGCCTTEDLEARDVVEYFLAELECPAYGSKIIASK